MRRLDELHLEAEVAGSRMLRDLRRSDGVEIGRDRVVTLMRRTGIEALYRRPNTQQPVPWHRLHPYLWRGVVDERPNQARAMAITDMPLGFPSLAAARERPERHTPNAIATMRDRIGIRSARTLPRCPSACGFATTMPLQHTE